MSDTFTGTDPRADRQHRDVPGLIASIDGHLARVVDLAPLLADLTDTHQRGVGFSTPVGRMILDKLVRTERHALRAQPDRRVGHAWLNRTSDVAGSGDVAAPGNFRTIAAEADVAFALAHNIRRIGKALTAAGFPVPPPASRPTNLNPAPATDARSVPELAARLAQLTRSAPSPRLLTSVDRDLGDVADRAQLVVDGADRIHMPEECPHCGRRSLIRHPRERLTRCEYDPTGHTQHPSPCVCTSAICACKTDPVGFRHEWLDNPPTKAHASTHQLIGLIKAEEAAVMAETQARDAIARVRALHTELVYYRFTTDCPGLPSDAPEGTPPHIWEQHEGGEICVTCPPAATYCTHCPHPTGEHLPGTAWPCPTLRAIDTPNAKPSKGTR